MSVPLRNMHDIIGESTKSSVFQLLQLLGIGLIFVEHELLLHHRPYLGVIYAVVLQRK
jgi:hypothetical protein